MPSRRVDNNKAQLPCSFPKAQKSKVWPAPLPCTFPTTFPTTMQAPSQHLPHPEARALDTPQIPTPTVRHAQSLRMTLLLLFLRGLVFYP